MSDLRKCPCGKHSKELSISGADLGGKWAHVSGYCCGEWVIEFRTMQEPLDSDECMKLAIMAWNGAPRAKRVKE
jgi:hypothetical protein